jgi:hypothetical protein
MKPFGTPTDDPAVRMQHDQINRPFRDGPRFLIFPGTSYLATLIGVPTGQICARELHGRLKLTLMRASLVICPLNNISYKLVAASQALFILRNTSVPLARHW